MNVLHIKDISEKILYIKERNLTKKIRGSKGQGKCWTKSVVLNNLERGGSEPKLKG